MSPEEKLAWIMSHVPFDLKASQPGWYALFTIESQWVYGNTPEECLDRAIETAARRGASRDSDLGKAMAEAMMGHNGFIK